MKPGETDTRALAEAAVETMRDLQERRDNADIAAGLRTVLAQAIEIREALERLDVIEPEPPDLQLVKG